ncbi:hypothetical protein N0V90_012025 [Kalmusia sp. IMI 367209]|nr:hypothetical protein N0V90_012025 [Kalmusia sp. IMI 367209]
MALVAHNQASLASHTHLRRQKSLRHPRYYAGQSQDDQNSPPFIYTGPRLQSASGSRKAKKVLGLVAQFERRSTEEAPQRDPNKAQKTLGLVTDLPRDRRIHRKPVSGEYNGTLEQKLAQAEKDIRRMSKKQDLAVEQTDEEGATADDERSDDEEEHGESGNEQHIDNDDEAASLPNPEKPPILDLPLLSSPQQLSFPETPIELDAGPDHELLIPPPRPRIRPHSYTAPRFSERPTNKIASSRSRGLRANSSPPNFSRPLSGCAPKPIPGEDMERDPLYIRFQDIDADPRSPMSPIGGTLISNEIKAALEKLEMGSKSRAQSPMPTSPPLPANRRSKPRWSSLPVSLMKLAAKKRGSKSEEDHLHLEKQPSKEIVTLTEENLQRWEDEVGYVPKMYRLGYDLLKSPAEVDMEVERATPVPPVSKTPSPAPLMMGAMLTPPMSPPTSPPLAQQSSNGSTIGALCSPSLTPTLTQRSCSASPSLAIRSSTTSTLIRRFPTVPAPQACLPAQPTLAAQKEALSMKSNNLLTCVLCKEVEHPSAFPTQPLSAQCLHAARTCKECVQHWIESWLIGLKYVIALFSESAQNPLYESIVY